MARNNRLYLRLSDDELALIEERAAEHGISPANYSRQRVLSTVRARSDDLAIRQLTGIANNVNQIARAMHAGGELKDDLAATIAEVRAAVFQLKKKEAAGNDNEQD